MTRQTPANIRTCAQAVAIGLLHDENTGNLPIPRDTLEAVIATTLEAAWPQIREHFATLVETQNPDRDADFSAGVDWAANTIRHA